jgi:hypothetical protein
MMAPAAGASTDRPSTKCAMRAGLHFKPGLNGGSNDFAFFKLSVKLNDCVGGGVSSATGRGGAEGSLVCTDGVVSGTASVKVAFDWDTGDRTDINAIIDFDGSKFTFGKVVFGLFHNDPVRAHFNVRPVRGDCATEPLVLSRLLGSISL